MSFQDILERVKPSVVGIGLLANPADPLSVVILGTGFVVDPDGLIMTNRHVAELLMGEREGVIGLRNAIARAVMFVERSQPHRVAGRELTQAYGMAPVPIVAVRMPPGARKAQIDYGDEPDLAVCQIDMRVLRLAVEKPLVRITFSDSSKVREGDEVGVCGFPLGLGLPRGTELHQLTAIAQKGIVAAILPHPGIPNPHAFQLDIAINPGSSGSPVFRVDDGTVVGIVFAAPVRPQAVEIQRPDGTPEPVTTISLPTGLGYAIPSNRYFEKPKTVARLPDVNHP
jgi:S1-C subfamily serine protease